MRRLQFIIIIVVSTVSAGLISPAASAAEFRDLLVDAQAQFEQEHYEKALQLYKQADQAEADHAAVTYNLGLCHLRLGDGDKAVQHFERVASRQNIGPELTASAFFNIGVIRTNSARSRLKELAAPATQPAEDVPPDSPKNIEELQGIANELLSAIVAFRQARDTAPGEDIEHNIRAARIMRRDVLGMLKRALEEKEKQDILEDPRAYLETLIFEQVRQVGLTRYLVIKPPAEPRMVREARRAGVRLQRKIMERTGTLADHLEQFRETADAPDATTTQPAEPTPREQLYQAVARQLRNAIEPQRDACAFLLDAETEPALDEQLEAMQQMRVALYAFPLEPGQTLVKADGQQKALKELVEGIESQSGWLRDPVLGEVEVPEDTEWEMGKAALFHEQVHVCNLLSLLRRQCEHIATTSQPADAPTPASGQQNPMLDPDLNRKLADAMAGVDELGQSCMTAITERDQAATLAAQEQLLEIITATLELLPKSFQQRIGELIVQQNQLNADVKAEAGEAGPEEHGETASPLDEIRSWAARLKSKLLPSDATTVAEAFGERQSKIQSETVIVQEDLRKEIPSGAVQQPAGGPSAQQDRAQAYIEAGKHLAVAGASMTDAAEGLDLAAVKDSFKPMEPEGPVQTAQTTALEELVKALAALQPPQQQEQEQQQDQQQQPQEPQPQEAEQDAQRNMDQIDREREKAMQELYQRRPREPIKNW